LVRAFLVLTILAGGCSYVTDRTPYEGACAPMAVVGWSPPPGDVGVPINPTIRVTLSDYPDPDTISVNSMLLTSGFFRVPEAYRVDLLTRSVVMTPIGQLTTDVGYAITVGSGVKSLAGCSGRTAQTTFITGEGSIDTPPPPKTTFADIQPILATRCAGGCHAAEDGTCLDAPVAGLSLCTTQARGALVDVPSTELAGISLVAPYDAARSYLIRKVVPGTPGGGPIPGTFGQREPPDAPLPPDQLRAMSDWIDGGALP
jgi:hypothetical protein